MSSINLAIVMEQLLLRKTLKYFLSDQQNLHVIVQAGDILEVLEKANNSSIDIMLMDLPLFESNCLDSLAALQQQYPEIKVLVMSASNDIEMVSQLLQVGIYGFISSADEPEELLQAIKTASGGRIHRNRIFTEALYRDRQVNARPVKDEYETLSEREKRLLQLIWEEKSNAEIANELFLGVRSIEKMRQDIKDKVGIRSTVGLLKYAISRRIIECNSLALLSSNKL